MESKQPEWGFEEECDGDGDAMALAALGIELEEPKAPVKRALAPASGVKDSAPAKKPKVQQRIGIPKPSRRTPRQCRGCQLWFAEEDMAIGQNFDHGCKNKLDNIQRISKAQGRTDWYKEVRSNDVKLQQVLVEYSSRVSSNPKRNSLPRSTTMNYLESVVCSTEVITEEAGKFMYERQYLAFGETFDGGKLSETQARHQWALWKSQVESPETDWPPSDNKGPNGELRIWVKTEDLIRFTNRMTRKKEVQMQHKQLKDPNEQQVAQLHKKLQIDHDFMAGKAMSGDIRSDAKGLWSNSGGQAFQSRASDVLDVTMLETHSADDDEQGPRPAEEDNSDDEKDDEGASASTSAKDAASAKAAKKTRWFDYDKNVGRAQRAFISSHETFVSELKFAVGKAEDALTLLGKSDAEVRSKCKSEERVLTSRKEFLSAVVAGDIPRLKSLIAKFSSATSACDAPPAPLGATQQAGADEAKASPSGKTSSTSRSVVGYAPPCASYEKLVTVQFVSGIAEEFQAATSVDDIKETKQKIASTRKPLKELASAVSDAAKELTMAREMASRPSAVGGRKCKGTGKGKAGRGVAGDFEGATAAPANTCFLLEMGPEAGADMPSVTVEGEETTAVDDQTVDYGKPLVIKCACLAKNMAEQSIVAILDNFQNEFDKSQAKLQNGRGGMRVPSANPAVVLARGHLAKLLPGFLNTAESESLERTMELNAFAVAKDQTKNSCEQDSLATLRFQARGTRKVFMTRAEDMIKYMVEVRKMPASVVTPSRASVFMKVMDKHAIAEYASQYALFHTTVAAQDVLYTPIGYLLVERTLQGCDIVGFCLRGVSNKDARAASVLAQLSAICRASGGADGARSADAMVAAAALVGGGVGARSSES